MAQNINDLNSLLALEFDFEIHHGLITFDFKNRWMIINNLHYAHEIADTLITENPPVLYLKDITLKSNHIRIEANSKIMEIPTISFTFSQPFLPAAAHNFYYSKLALALHSLLIPSIYHKKIAISFKCLGLWRFNAEDPQVTLQIQFIKKQICLFYFLQYQELLSFKDLSQFSQLFHYFDPFTEPVTDEPFDRLEFTAYLAKYWADKSFANLPIMLAKIWQDLVNKNYINQEFKDYLFDGKNHFQHSNDPQIANYLRLIMPVIKNPSHTLLDMTFNESSIVAYEFLQQQPQLFCSSFLGSKFHADALALDPNMVSIETNFTDAILLNKSINIAADYVPYNVVHSCNLAEITAWRIFYADQNFEYILRATTYDCIYQSSSHANWEEREHYGSGNFSGYKSWLCDIPLIMHALNFAKHQDWPHLGSPTYNLNNFQAKILWQQIPTNIARVFFNPDNILTSDDEINANTITCFMDVMRNLMTNLGFSEENYNLYKLIYRYLDNLDENCDDDCSFEYWANYADVKFAEISPISYFLTILYDIEQHLKIREDFELVDEQLEYFSSWLTQIPAIQFDNPPIVLTPEYQQTLQTLKNKTDVFLANLKNYVDFAIKKHQDDKKAKLPKPKLIK